MFKSADTTTVCMASNPSCLSCRCQTLKTVCIYVPQGAITKLQYLTSWGWEWLGSMQKVCLRALVDLIKCRTGKPLAFTDAPAKSMSQQVWWSLDFWTKKNNIFFNCWKWFHHQTTLAALHNVWLFSRTVVVKNPSFCQCILKMCAGVQLSNSISICWSCIRTDAMQT